jgi:putative transposase
MPRRTRKGLGGLVHHVINRASRRTVIFGVDEDYLTFVTLLGAAVRLFGMRLLEFCVMPNHWHLILWPHEDLQLSSFMHWLTLTQTQRWHAARGTTGTGSLYQGRFKAIPVQADDHFIRVARYVVRNPVRAGLIERVEDWSWSSAGTHGRNCNLVTLAEWPVPQPANWTELANDPLPDADVAAVRGAIADGWPYGDAEWTEDMARRFKIGRRERTLARVERIESGSRPRLDVPYCPITGHDEA